jgi:4-amino-4-deoxy-L-arabinose transferase-like glycosyltransferase
MTKGLIGAFFPMGIIFFWVLYFREWGNLKNYCIFTGTIIFLIIALPWHVLAQIQNPDFFNFYIIQQHFLRYFTHYAGRGEPWWFFIAVFLIGLFPWIAFFYQSLKFNLSKQSFADERKNEYIYKHKVVIFLFIWFVIVFIFYSFSTSKLITYILPVFPSCAILLGNYFAKKWDQKKNKVKDVNYGFIIIAVLSIFAGIGIFFTSIFWDFKSQGVPVSELYLVGFFLIVNGIVTSCVLRKGVGIAFIALLITFSWALYSANPIVTILNGKSIKPLALILQKRLQPKDEVACYDDYYQDLPFYLQSQVDVVHSKGELEYGVLHDDATRQWMISYDTFFKRWNSKKKMYMIIKDSRYNDLVRDKAARLYVIGRYADKLLIVNAK